MDRESLDKKTFVLEAPLSKEKNKITIIYSDIICYHYNIFTSYNNNDNI